MVQGFKLPREAYVPKGAVRITDRASDAVAFVYVTGKGRPAAVAFHGRAAKPDWHHVYSPGRPHENEPSEIFLKAAAKPPTRKAERRAEATKPHGSGGWPRAGGVSWGYDQTNVNFYQVTGLDRSVHGRGQGHRAGRREHGPGGMGDGQGGAGARRLQGRAVAPTRRRPSPLRPHRRHAGRRTCGTGDPRPGRRMREGS